MDMRRDELDEASYQLMMDIQTGRNLEPPQPRRSRKLLGMTLVVLGGFVGLLLTSGRLTSEPTLPEKAALSPSRPTVSPPLQPKVSPNRTELPSSQDAPVQRPPMADLQPAPRKPASNAKSLSATPVAPNKSKSASKRPQRVSNSKRVAKRSGTEQSQTALQHRSLQLWSRSPAHEFDPNAELVRSSP